MSRHVRLIGLGCLIGIGVIVLSVDFAIGGRGRGGGGGARGGGGGRVGGGGGISRPAGGGIGGGGISRPAGGGFSPSINRSPSVSPPRVSQPSRPAVGGGGPKIGGGQPNFGGGARDRPGVVTPPSLSPGNRPNIGGGIAGKGVDPGFGVRPPVGSGPGIGKGGLNPPGIGKGGLNPPGIGKGGLNPPGIGKGGINPPGLGKVDPGFGKGGSLRPGGPTTSLPGLGLGLGAGIGAGIGAGKAGDFLGRRQDGIGNRQENIADRSQNLQNRLDQRQDFRNQSQDRRQDYMNDRREDWQNWHDDYYHHHDGWYHGAWNGHWGDYWDHMWSDHTAAMVLGTTMWGLNRMSYWFGYGNYSNPYYSEPLVVDNTVIDYSQPLAEPPVVVDYVAPPATAPPAIGTAPSTLPPGVSPEGMAQFDAARAAFMEGNYQTALTATNKALATMPKDAVVNEFRALVLFALGNYRESAATLHPVLAVGPGWDWTTMVSLYPNVDTYTKQLRSLETYIAANPKAADAHFLLAYHYLTCGHQENAARELTQVQALVKNDTVSAQLLQMLGKAPVPAAPTIESTAKYDTAKLVGTWNASRGGKATFELTMTKDKAFTWTYREGKTKQEVKGVYALDDNVLALEPDAGGVMLAEITDPQGGSFVFRTVGGPKGDPGLTFKAK